jgi:menaquinone-dependent protoporphyrinogen oxidase
MMGDTVLVAFATRYGSTQEVAEAIAAELRGRRHAVEVQRLREVKSLDAYAAIVMGAPLFMFRWHKDAFAFLSRHREALQKRRVAVFALGPVHAPHDETEWTDSQAQLDKELAKVPWFEPDVLAVFGGKYDPARLGFPLKAFAGKEPASDIRDWSVIRSWAESLPEKLQLPSP